LEKGVNINHQDHRGQTALMYFAQFERHPWTIQWLLRHGADVNVVDKSGQTALDKLSSKYWDDKKRKLLLDAGAKSALNR
ncbi:MAG: ankyrin repeat domain-containing protein, partial [bacterium]